MPSFLSRFCALQPHYGQPGNVIDTLQALQRHGVIVKAWAEPGYQTFIRMSLALPADNDVFLQALLREVSPA